MSLTLAQVLALDDRKVDSIEVPEWGGRVYVRALSGEQRGAAIDRADEEGDARITARVVAAGWCDEKGKPIEASELQIQALARKNAGALMRVYRKICDISGLRDTALEDAKKNSPNGQSESSG